MLMRPSKRPQSLLQPPHGRLQAVQTPVIPVVAQMIRDVPGTISLGQGVVNYGPPAAAFSAMEALRTVGGPLERALQGLAQAFSGLKPRVLLALADAADERAPLRWAVIDHALQIDGADFEETAAAIRKLCGVIGGADVDWGWDDTAAAIRNSCFSAKQHPGVLLDVCFDDKGDLDRESFLIEVKNGHPVINATLPPLNAKK